MKFGAISWKIDNLPITAEVRIWEFFCSHVTHILLWLSPALQISFLLSKILVYYRFPFLILRFSAQNHLALLKDRFFNKILLIRANTRRLFFTKLEAQIILFSLVENNFRFLSLVWIQCNRTLLPMGKMHPVVTP